MSRYLSYLITLTAVLLLWYAASIQLGANLLPSPISVLSLLLSEAGSAEYWTHVGISSWRIIAGMGLAFITAVPLGLIMGSSPEINRIFSPVINMSYPVPKIVLLPIILLLFGIGDLSKIILIMLIIFFQVFITSRDAARNINKDDPLIQVTWRKQTSILPAYSSAGKPARYFHIDAFGGRYRGSSPVFCGINQRVSRAWIIHHRCMG